MEFVWNLVFDVDEKINLEEFAGNGHFNEDLTRKFKSTQ